MRCCGAGYDDQISTSWPAVKPETTSGGLMFAQLLMYTLFMVGVSTSISVAHDNSVDVEHLLSKQHRVSFCIGGTQNCLEGILE